MKVIREIPKTEYHCDGCGYLIGMTEEEWREGEKLEDHITVLKVPWDTDSLKREEHVWLDFHFHSSSHYPTRRDCFRYWAHNPRIMKDSLIARELPEEEVDEFMSQMLYKTDQFGPGIAKEVKA